MSTQTKSQVISQILFTKRYATIAITSGIGLGIIYYTLTMVMLPIHLDTIMKTIPAYTTISIALTIGISGLAGVNFAMMAYKIKMVKMMSNLQVKKPNTPSKNTLPILGGVFAAFTPGCPACTAPLAVILGAVGGLSIFPMQGLELKAISAGVLIFSIWWISRGLQTKSCCKIQ